MEESSLLKTNFIGRDGFVWWIGQIAKEKAWAQQVQGDGWGVRYKVRIMGYHPETEAELKDEDLPWAQVMMPPGVGTGGAMIFSSVKFAQAGPYASNNPEPRQHIAETAPEPAPAPVENVETVTEIILEKPSWRARLTGFFKN